MAKKPAPKGKKPEKKAAKPVPPQVAPRKTPGRDREALPTLLGDLRGGPMKRASRDEE